MRLGYNTNGFAHHDINEALRIIAELGYQSVALTIDHHVLNPYEPDLQRRTAEMRKLLDRLGLRCVIETGSRFLLDARNKHQPTLVSDSPEARQRRLAFLFQAVDIAGDLAADAVSFWSGTPRDQSPFPVHLQRLMDCCDRLCDYAAKKQVRLAFEPEPGMLIDTMARFQELFERLQNSWFGLTVDVGHLHCQGETPIADHLRRWRHCLWNIHIEDMCRGLHEHLMFGEGEIEFGPVLRTLVDIDYSGGVHVELSRHSHDAVETARRALAFLSSTRE